MSTATTEASQAVQGAHEGSQYDSVPDELKEQNIWLLWDSAADTNKQPHWRGDRSISWSDPDCWHSFEEAKEAANERDSWGIGYVNGIGNDDAPRQIYATVDIDGCLDEDGDMKEWVPSLDIFFENHVYIERSLSGSGLHIPLVGYEPPEWWSDVDAEGDHEGVDVLTNKFCAVTGDKVVGSGDEVGEIDATPWLEEVEKSVTGEFPSETVAQGHDYTGGDTDQGLTEEQAREALSHISPDIKYPKWRNIGYALVDEFGKPTAQSLFEEWSRSGSKWNKDAGELSERIIADADSNGKVTGGTLVYHAKEGGCEPCSSRNSSSRQSGSGGIDEPGMGMTKSALRHVAGLAEDESISGLTDREKAAYVWKLIKGADGTHVRSRPEDGTLWTYESGVWRKTGKQALRNPAYKVLVDGNYGKNVLSELEEQARADPKAAVGVSEMGVETGKVAVENGLLDLDAAAGGKEGAVRELRPDDYALTRLPVEYEPDADYSEWESLVEEWCEEGRADALQEYVGYCLHVGDMPIHRALLLVGDGANGKSTFLSVVRALLGEDSVGSTEIQALANEDEAVADFEGKLANINDDLSSRGLGKGVGMFKKLVGGDSVRARRLYENGFEFEPTGKHLYAANEVPDVSGCVKDSDKGFWRRWLLVEFPNHYPPEERESGLRDRLTEPEFLSGVLNWAIEGRRRLLEQDGFTGEYTEPSKKRALWKSWGDSSDAFILNHVERDEDAASVSTGYVYERYEEWCQENGRSAIEQQTFTEKLRDKPEDYGYAPSVRVEDEETPRSGFKRISFSKEVLVEEGW